jgi:hypothetical protein
MAGRSQGKAFGIRATLWPNYKLADSNNLGTSTLLGGGGGDEPMVVGIHPLFSIGERDGIPRHYLLFNFCE